MMLDEKDYARRFVTYDISLGWYNCVIRHLDAVPDWLKGEFAPYSHAYFIDNFANQIKARYHYLTRNYLPLLSYIDKMKRRESILYGRVEMLAMEACVHYQLKNKTAAWDSLKEAYETAMPNNIVTPFIELGKDMRTLSTVALSKNDIGIPKEWLEDVRRKALYYAGKQSLFISEHKAHEIGNIKFSAREHDILSDLYKGLTQAEIASKRSLSINTVKMNMRNIYNKLDIHKISDLIRIVAEHGLV